MENATLRTCMTFITSTQLIEWYVPFLKLQHLVVPPSSSTIRIMFPTCTGHCVVRLDDPLTKTPRVKLLSMGGDKVHEERLMHACLTPLTFS